MAEQQLVDYIKKARTAGQADSRSRTLLIQNGWTEAEINEALLATNEPSPTQQPVQPVTAELEPEPQMETVASVQPKTQVSNQPEPAFQRQSQVSGEAQVRVQPAVTPAQQPVQSEPVMNSQPAYEPARSERMPRNRSMLPVILKLLIVIILLVVIGVGGYFALWQTGLFSKAYNKVFSYFNPKTTVVTPIVNESENTQVPTTPPILDTQISTKTLSSVPEDYDVSKITVAGFNQSGDQVIFCAPLKTSITQISCFLNGQKLLDNPFAFKPYWIGMDSTSTRIVFLYYDSAKKQAFAYEDGREGTRYNGTITYPVFSADSKDFAFMVMGNDGKNFVVVNDKAFVPHDKIFTPPQFSADGRYVLYGAKDGQNILWVADEINELPEPPGL